MDTDPDWSDVSRQLNDLNGRIAAAHQAALDSIGADNPDVLLHELAALGQAIAQSPLNLPVDSAAPPAHIRLQVKQIQTALEELTSLNHRLSAQAQRALAVLMPDEQVRSYSRLGGRGMGSVGTRSGYLKA
jgi:hypothetical protein